MKTFRVYLAKPETPQGVWNFTETVVAANSSEAVASAYSTWVSTASSYVPPLAQCRVMVNALSGKPASKKCLFPLQERLDKSVYEAAEASQKAYVELIKNKTASLLGSKLDGEFNVANSASGFHYGITYGVNAYYNEYTLKDLEALITMDKELGMLKFTPTLFSSLYHSILGNITYGFSKADRAMMEEQAKKASAQIVAVLKEFENAGGKYTSPLPFGGKLQDVFNQMLDLYKSFESIPDTLASLRDAIFYYKEAAEQSCVLQLRYYEATERIKKARKNIAAPSHGNGGLEIANDKYYVGYEKLPTANDLVRGLTTKSNAITISTAMSSFSSNTAELHMEGESFGCIIVPFFFGIKTSKATYDLSRYTSRESKINIDMTYPGVTVLSSSMMEQSVDNLKGWYENIILSEVIKKTGMDATGYMLTGSEFKVDELFGKNKTLARLKTFVISQEPTIVIKMQNVDVSKVESDFKVTTKATINIFGIFNIGSNASYSVHDVKTDISTLTITLTFGPANPGGSTPAQDAVTNVLGGVASYPPNEI